MKKTLFIFILCMILPLVSGQVYNTTGIDNATDFYTYIYELNLLLDYWVGTSIVLIFGIITFVVSADKYKTNPFLPAGFIMTLTSLFFLPLGLIPVQVFITSLIFLALSGFFSNMS